jgi:hypothetical protein
VKGAFTQAIEKAENAVRNRSTLVKPNRWQSMDVSKLAEATTHEVLNYTLSAPVQTEDLDALRADIKPNLPWADDHFLERVGGVPLNPGKEWARWPWGNSADKFRNESMGPKRVTSERWAYLAGLVDGDGSFSGNDEGRAPRIKITQVDREYLTGVQSEFGVGTLRENTSRSGVSNRGVPSDDSRGSLIWRISAREEVRWILIGIIPFLRLKRDQAIHLLSILPTGDRRYNEDPPPRWETGFAHTYMERMWAPKDHRGIRYQYGDAQDVVQHLIKDPMSRQAYLPIWHPEDTGKLEVRVPCTLGYHFIQRHGFLHCTYYIRSCDLMRHFRDDIYLTVRLQLWMLDQLRNYGPTEGNESAHFWAGVKPGIFTMHIVSLHLFRNDYIKMFGG